MAESSSSKTIQSIDSASKLRFKSNTQVIGLHMRHQSKLDDGSEDRGEQKCLRHLISTLMPDFTPLSSRSSAIDHGTDNKTTTERRMSASMQQRRRRHLESESSCAKFTSCVILIASDRLHASVRNAAYAKELGCSVVTREDISESVSGRKVKEGARPRLSKMSTACTGTAWTPLLMLSYYQDRMCL